jgi:hypothetical protein
MTSSHGFDVLEPQCLAPFSRARDHIGRTLIAETIMVKPGLSIGEFISGEWEGKTCEAVVLDRVEDTGALLVMWLSDHRCAEITPEKLVGWSRAAIPDARWVEAYKAGASEPFFAGYLPTFHAALAVCQTFQTRDADVRVEIFTASEYEDELVDTIRDPASARGYS